MSSSKLEFTSIQALRAVAALMVVVYHCAIMWAERIGNYPIDQVPPNFSAGVDIFFVISGFVMVVSSQRLTGLADGWRTFLWRRFVRIVPFYWLVTSARLFILALIPGMALHAHPDPANIVSSYLFLPSFNEAGELRPVLADGWTLSYEMLFYVLFAFALWLRAPVLRVLAPTLGFLALLSFVRADDWPAIAALADTLVLEFLLGVCIGMAVLRGFKLPLPTALAIMTAAFAIILSIGTGPVIGAARLVEPQSLRVLAWGLPAAAIVLAAASSEQALGRLLPRWSLDLGEASYSIYLTHSFVLPVIGMAIVRLSVSTHVAPVLAVVLGVLCSSAAGVATYRLVERPLLGALRKVTRRTAAAA